MTEDQGYRAPDVVRIVGVTYRQLDYWARTDLVTPSVQDAHGSGTQRLYGFRDLVLLRSIKDLLETGVSLHKVRVALDFLRDHLQEAPEGMTLVSDGVSIYACKSDTEIIDALKQGQGSMFTLPVTKVWTELERSLGGKAATRS
ncbi:MAG TPA: MerR family transcriptional regulator [Actinomycetota bacterium]